MEQTEPAPSVHKERLAFCNMMRSQIYKDAIVVDLRAVELFEQKAR
jgi:hypothetical protein